MDAEQSVVRAAVPADLERVAAIYSHYVTTSVATFEEACADAGARQVIADTGSDASVALRRRFGFAHAGRFSGVGRKHGRWIDTVLMQRELGPGG